MQHYTIEQLAAMLMAAKQKEYNNFKTEQDRKYAVYSLLRYKSEPYKISYMHGSNQILVTNKDNNEIYNSDTETHEQQYNFKPWFMQIITNWLKVNHPNGIDF